MIKNLLIYVFYGAVSTLGSIGFYWGSAYAFIKTLEMLVWLERRGIIYG